MEIDQAAIIKRLEAMGMRFVPKTQKSNDARIKNKQCKTQEWQDTKQAGTSDFAISSLAITAAIESLHRAAQTQSMLKPTKTAIA